jgi:hypothetical protein
VKPDPEVSMETGFLVASPNSPPQMRRGSGAQRHGGGLMDLPVTLVQALPVEYEDLQHAALNL